MNFGVFLDVYNKIRQDFERKPFSKKLFRNRNFSQIKESKFLTGCTDFAIIAKKYLEDLGIKSVFVDCVNFNSKGAVEGHVYLYIEEKFFFDPVTGCIILSEDFLKNKWDYYYFASAENNLKSLEELRKISRV